MIDEAIIDVAGDKKEQLGKSLESAISAYDSALAAQQAAEHDLERLSRAARRTSDEMVHLLRRSTEARGRAAEAVIQEASAGAIASWDLLREAASLEQDFALLDQIHLDLLRSRIPAAELRARTAEADAVEAEAQRAYALADQRQHDLEALLVPAVEHEGSVQIDIKTGETAEIRRIADDLIIRAAEMRRGLEGAKNK
jgi:hypothetical protein